MEQNRLMLASVLSISQQKPSDIFMSIRLRMFSTRPNGNGDAVTEAFINEIAENQGKYLCIPLCADTSKLVNHDYKNLGHMYNPRTGRFLSQIIGGFCAFEKVNDEYGVSLIGEARVAKRNKEICEALETMYAEGNLNFSFEITAAKTITENGITYVDADEGNNLIGMAVVSIPAYPEAKALALVAEADQEDRMLRSFEGALIDLAEMTFDDIQEALYRAVYEALPKTNGEPDPCWHFYFREISMSRAILNVGTKAYAVEYMIDEADHDGKQVIVKDVYEVEYQRKEGEETMTLEEVLARNAELEAEIAQEKQKAEDIENEKQLKEDELKEKDEKLNEKEEEIAQKNERCSELEAQIEALNQQIAELTPYKERIEAMEAEAAAKALAEKREKMKAYAQKNGLDIEDQVIAEAIENMNYEALVAQVMEVEEEEEAKAPHLAGFEDMTTDGRDWLFQSRK